MFTGGLGMGKSRAAAAVAQGYRNLSLLSLGHVAEVATADLIHPKPWEAARLLDETASRVPGGVLMITDAHAWYDLPGHGQQMTRALHQLLNQVRDHPREELAVILAGQARPLGALLRASPALAARFPVVIDFLDYTADQLAAIFTALATEAGFTLTPAAAHKVGVVLGQAENRSPSGNARAAIRLLDQTVSSQAHRIMSLPAPGPAALTTICPDDLPGQIDLDKPIAGDERPGQYL